MSTAHVSPSSPPAAELSFDPAELSLRSLLAATLAPLRLAATRKKLQLEIFVAPDVPDALAGDADSLRQILIHVVENAIKFTETGGISVRVHRENVSGCVVRLRFAVSDTGAGIPLNKQQLIFQGRGLAAAASLVEQMGGQIAVESQLAKGSSFRFTVQLLLAPEKETGPCRPAGPLAASTPAPVRPLHVLVADDSRFNVLFTRSLLTKQGHTVAVAGSGREALEAMARQKFDLVVMDVQMPEMDGLQATAAIRQHENESGGHVPILAMTAHALQEDQEMCRRAGMDDYICKPVSAENLLRAIASLTHAAPAAASAALPPASQIDRETLFEEVGGDPELLRRLAKIFDHEVERRLGQLREAVAGGNAVAVDDLSREISALQEEIAQILEEDESCPPGF